MSYIPCGLSCPGRFKDFISLPKSNLYQSLHATVVGPGGDRIEFQIRTGDMNEIAEEGIAAHWRYKERTASTKRTPATSPVLRELVKDVSDAKEFLEAVKGDIVPETVCVLTPKGDIKELPVGSTPVDFAYSIHSEVGHRCVGAKISGRIVPLRYKLVSGDAVEIITAPSHSPSKDWLKFVVTPRARSRIKQWIRVEERNHGRRARNEAARGGVAAQRDDDGGPEDGKDAGDPEGPQLPERRRCAACHRVRQALGPPARQQAHRRKARRNADHQGRQAAPGGEERHQHQGHRQCAHHVGRCCYPVPGDKIVGFITKGKGVTIHRTECSNLERTAVDTERLIGVEWSQQEDITTSAKLFVECVDRPGMLANMSALISAVNVNISSPRSARPMTNGL
ncbi:MAG: TGS domain-containing protein [Desulfobacterales bacterium]|nr:TGS domain-containing protein [Desulfobacterales bacterium]